MSYWTLSNLYKRNNVKRRKAFPAKISQFLSRREFELSQIVSARRVASLIIHKENICYYDESSLLYGWGNKSNYLWSPKDHPIHSLVLQPKNRHDAKHRMELYLAIGDGLRDGHAKLLCEKQSTENLLKFLDILD